MNKTRKVSFSGIQPSGNITLGNVYRGTPELAVLSG